MQACERRCPQARSFACAARAKQKSALPRIQPIALRVNNVVDAIQQEPEREQHEKQSQPQLAGMENIRVAERHKVKHRRGRPQTWPRNLQQERQVRSSQPLTFFFWKRHRRIGHLHQYTRLRGLPRLSNRRRVTNYFATFESSESHGPEKMSP